MNDYKLLSKYISIIEYKKKYEIEKPKLFFENSYNTIIAVDTSGSTHSHNILENEKNIIKNIIKGKKGAKNFLNHIYAWHSYCNILPIDQLVSSGNTDPSSIFKITNNHLQNLLITTDGKISREKVQNIIKVLETKNNLKNVIAIIFPYNNMSLSPSQIDISVFYPFINHIKKNHGSFYLFCYYKDNNGLSLLMKILPDKINDSLPNPPSHFDETTSWNIIPYVSIDKIRSITVTEGSDPISLKPGEIIFHDKYRLNLKQLMEDLEISKNNNDDSLLASSEFSNFIFQECNAIINSISILSNKDTYFDYLRKILNEWKRVKSIYINGNKTRNKKRNKKLRQYKELLTLKSQTKDPEKLKEINNEISEISKSLFLILQKGKMNTKKFNKYIDSLFKKINKAQDINSNINLPKSFTLESIHKISNRVKRAEHIETPFTEISWDLSGNPCYCEECIICGRENLVSAILLIDLQYVDPNQLEFNLSDFALNDRLNVGTQCTKSFPTGEFCIECAYIIYQLKRHPLTRQPVKCVLPLVDPEKGQNLTLIKRSVCAALFANKFIPSCLQVLLGTFSVLKETERFSKNVYNWVMETCLFHSKGSLFSEMIGVNKILIEALYDVINFTVDVNNYESIYIPLRNKTLTSMRIIGQLLYEYYDQLIINDKMSREQLVNIWITFMRRIFIQRTVIGSVITYIKKAVYNNEKDYSIDKLLSILESELFDTKLTSIPLKNSSKEVSLKSCHLLQYLYKNHFSFIRKEVCKFEKLISNIKKTEFQLISNENMTILILNLYLIISQNKINLSAINEEHFMPKLKQLALYDEKDPALANIFLKLYHYYLQDEKSDQEEKINLHIIIETVAPYRDIPEITVDHYNFFCRFASHLYSPVVTCCSICGMKFINSEELIKNNYNSEIIKKMKCKRNQHFAEIYNTEINSNYPTNHSSIASYHAAVRDVCCSKKYNNLERPTRNLIKDILKYLKNKQIGNIYYKELVEGIVCISWDFLQRKKNIGFINEKLTIRERAKIEMEVNQDDYITKPVTTDGLTQMELDELYLPYGI